MFTIMMTVLAILVFMLSLITDNVRIAWRRLIVLAIGGFILDMILLATIIGSIFYI